MIDLPLSNASIPYPDFVLHTVIDPDKFDLNNAELQGKLNATINQVNLNTPEIALKAYKTYVDSQDTGLQNQITSLTSTVGTKATIAYVDSENADQDTVINGHTSTLATHTSQIATAQADILLRTVKTGDHPGTWQSKNISYFDNQIALKANQSTTYTKTEVDTGLNLKADKTTTYTKTEVDNALALKADTSTVNTQLATKANQSTTYTKTEVDNLLSPKATTAYVDSQLSAKANTIDVYSKATLNDTGASSGATLIGSQAIAGVTGTTVRAQIVNLKSQIDAAAAGSIPDGSVTPAKLDRAYLQLTGGTLSGTLTGTTIAATTFTENGTNLTSKYAQLSGATFTGTVNGTTINATTLQEGGTALSSKYLTLTGGTLTGDLFATKAATSMQLSMGSTTDDTRFRFITTGTASFIQSGTAASGVAKRLDITGINGTVLPLLNISSTSSTFSGTISGTTINATTNLQEAGTNLSSKYAPLASPTFTGTLTAPTINATSNLQEGGVNLTSRYLRLTGGQLTGDLDIARSVSGTMLQVRSSLDNSALRFFVSGPVNVIESAVYDGSAAMDMTIRGGNNGFIPTLTLKADTVQIGSLLTMQATDATVKNVLQTVAGDGNGFDIALGAGRNTIVGAGESYQARLTDAGLGTNEALHLIADQNVHIMSNAQTYASRKTLTMDNNAKITLEGDCVLRPDRGTRIDNLGSGTNAMLSGATVTMSVNIADCPNGWMTRWKQDSGTAFLHYEPIYKFQGQDSVTSISCGNNTTTTVLMKMVTISGGGTTLIGSSLNDDNTNVNRVLDAVYIF